MPTQAQRNKAREKYQAKHPNKTAKQQTTKAKMNSNKEPHRVNTDQPQPTTDLAK